jgi:hypothetical protein
LGLGFAALILAPVWAIILFITFIGYYIAFMVLTAYLFMLVLAGLLGVIFVGSALWQWFKKAPQMEFSWRTALLGAVVMSLLQLIPFVGWIICIVVMLMALGALVSRFRPTSTSIARVPEVEE